MLRFKRIDVRSEAENLCEELGEHQRASFELFTVKPWKNCFGKVSVFPALMVYRYGRQCGHYWKSHRKTDNSSWL